jgi:hypothetical protein
MLLIKWLLPKERAFAVKIKMTLVNLKARPTVLMSWKKT